MTLLGNIVIGLLAVGLVLLLVAIASDWPDNGMKGGYSG